MKRNVKRKERLTPSRRREPLRNSLSPTASLKSTVITDLRSIQETKTANRDARTRTGHRDDHIQINLQIRIHIPVYTELIIRPSPEKLAEVVEEE